MTDHLNELKNKLLSLDITQSHIQKTSEEFLECIKEDETLTEDLVKLWKFHCLNRSNKLAYIFLANDIIQNSYFQKLKLHEVFFYHLTEVFPTMCNSLSEKIKKEIFRVIDIWEERNIYEPSKLENLRQLLNVTTIPNSNTLDNPLFQNYLKNNKIKISEKIKDFAYNLEEYTRYGDLISKSKDDSGLIDSETFNQHGTSKKDVKKYIDYQNDCRGKLLQNAADAIKKQSQVNYKHVYYLQEVDKLLDKISSFKKVHQRDKQNEMKVDN